MRILPVLDLQGGQVVRARAGQRHTYTPLVDGLGGSPEPLTVARAFQHHLGLSELYLADLDAIAGKEAAWSLYDRLHQAGFTLWVDAGVREHEQAVELARAGIANVVVGLESVAGPTALQSTVTDLGERVVFSLDLRGGVPILGSDTWKGTDGPTIAREALSLGTTRILVLDLTRVGVGQGTGTEKLLADLCQEYPGVELLAGGGVRDAADLVRLQQIGVASVLVSTALHAGIIDRATLERLSGSA